jgi:hypothetical protein
MGGATIADFICSRPKLAWVPEAGIPRTTMHVGCRGCIGV